MLQCRGGCQGAEGGSPAQRESAEERLPGRLKDNSLWDAAGTCEVRVRIMEGWFTSRSRRTKHHS